MDIWILSRIFQTGWRFLRDWLTEVQKFDNAAVLKPEYVDNSRARFTRLLLHVGMDDDEISLGNRMLHFPQLIRILPSILLHPCHKRLWRPFEKCIVMFESFTDKL